MFLENGRLEIDNNLVENAIRPTACVGKKNWLFVGEAGAGQRGAIIYTIIETCRAAEGIDPYAYLRDVLSRLPRMTNHQIPEITPEAWAKSHRPSQKAPLTSEHIALTHPRLPIPLLSSGTTGDAYDL